MRSSRLAAASVFLSLFTGCGGVSDLDPGNSAVTDPNAPCTDPEKCCPKEKITCTGDPDKQLICTCSDLWDCSKNPAKCEQQTPVPSGGNTWSCSWTSKDYACTSKGTKDAPPGGAGWQCVWLAGQSSWRCTKDFPPNPTNNPPGGAAWKCTVDELHGKLVCDKTTPPTPKADSGTAPAPKKDSGTTWPPQPPPKPGDQCVPGQKRWCDGPAYCGWGLQDCLPSGTWGTCMEETGKRPNTKCACFNQTFEAACCETPDCLVPAGTSGTDCTFPGKLCDPCNPLKPNCTEPGGKCVALGGQSFCSVGCSSTTPCPLGYLCLLGQCVPFKLKCSY